jgi:hypothetical protein
MLKKLFNIIAPVDEQARTAQIQRAALHDAARMGGTLFGPIPKGGRREFFCLDRHTLVWHEEWHDERKTHHARTTRYDIRPHGVFKAQDGQPYQVVNDEELVRLYQAAYQYRANIHARFDPLLAAAH